MKVELKDVDKGEMFQFIDDIVFCHEEGYSWWESVNRALEQYGVEIEIVNVNDEHDIKEELHVYEK